MENTHTRLTKGTPTKPYKKPFCDLHIFGLLKKSYCRRTNRLYHVISSGGCSGGQASRVSSIVPAAGYSVQPRYWLITYSLVSLLLCSPLSFSRDLVMPPRRSTRQKGPLLIPSSQPLDPGGALLWRKIPIDFGAFVDSLIMASS